MKELCADSYSYAEVLRKAGRKQGGGAQITLKKKIEEFEIDISHFTGQQWYNAPKAEHNFKGVDKEKYTLDEVFIKNSPVAQKVLRGYIERHHIIDYKCIKCGCDGTWQDGEISLELDHIDGINNNNEIDNLRYLCPNCHALTKTYRGRNKEVSKKETISEEEFCDALRSNKNIRQALITLGLNPQGGNYTRAKQLAEKYNIDI